jgi:release factor glutamine methyltransferase
MQENELILTSILGCRRVDLYTNDFSLDKKQRELLAGILSQRERGFPLQYILGKTEFFGLNLRIKENVFIPRPETELLVEEVLSSVEKLDQETCLNILDICSGSGNISVALAKFIDKARITAIDINKEAVSLAKENAILNSVSGKIYFLEQDVFGLKVPKDKFDIIVSNPPYIQTGDLRFLPEEVSHEPRISLDGGLDGLRFYKQILVLGKKILCDQGLVFLEIGFNQADKIKDLAREFGNFELVKLIPDYAGFDRVMILKYFNRAQGFNNRIL